MTTTWDISQRLLNHAQAPGANEYLVADLKAASEILSQQSCRERIVKTWRDVPITAGMFCNAVSRWSVDRTSLADAIQLAAQSAITE